MQINKNQIILHALSQRQDAVRRTLTTAIREAFPERHIDIVEDLYWDCFRFAHAGHCSLEPATDFDPDVLKTVEDDKITGYPNVAWWHIDWRNEQLEAVKVDINEGHHRRPFVVLSSPSSEVASSFLLELSKFANDIEGAVLVFQDGCWSYSEELYKDIANSTFDNLILPPGMIDLVRSDVQQWLDARDLYDKHGIPWKRGMILVGPPGNGKTHMIKALVNHFPLSALYVRSFKAEFGSDEQNISAVFEKARECAPAILILEDLDTLVDDDNRSHFLNELDGFARNYGILTVATANDPASLDPALVNRPSRFDRRHVFDLPVLRDRANYLQFFTSSLNETLRLSNEEANSVGEATDGFSFAYLKELVLSSMMAWISDERGASFAATLLAQTEPLRVQMTIDTEPTPTVVNSPQADTYPVPYAYRMYSRRRR